MPDVVHNSTSSPAQIIVKKTQNSQLTYLHADKPRLKKKRVPGQVWVPQAMTRAIESSSDESDGETVDGMSEMYAENEGDNRSLKSLHV